MLQQHQPQSSQHHQPHLQRLLWVLLLITASLACIYFYVIPWLASTGVGGSATSGRWSDARQRQVAFDLAQSVQAYRTRIHERRRINYGDALLEATGVPRSFRPPNPFDGMDSPSGAINDTHSETKLKGWALATIRKNLQNLPAGSVINVLIFTQVKVCPDCRRDIQQWATQLQQAAPAGVTVFLFIWQQTNFAIDHPDQTPVNAPNDVEFAVSRSAP